MDNILNIILIIFIGIALSIISCEVALGQYTIKQVKYVKQYFYQKLGFIPITF